MRPWPKPLTDELLKQQERVLDRLGGTVVSGLRTALPKGVGLNDHRDPVAKSTKGAAPRPEAREAKGR
jgi:hypothetical protein